ncbi:MAG TPA: SDR family oxidoreductase [Cyclobacteriaceae bacterium]|nr:SDR family oxidoreductase [Cyclobacteriaceae bacterium]
MSSLKGQVIWITGASSGIGEALVYHLAHQGVRLILSSRRKEELERVKGNCPQYSQADIRVLPLDLSESSTLKLTAEAATQIFGHIDILVNNGGISQRSMAKDTVLDVDRRLMEVDYFGTIALTKGVIPHFIQRKKGHFVVISSVMGMIGAPNRTGYAAAKHALHGFFDSLRAEMWKESKDIHVTIVCPGWIRTNLAIHALTASGAELNDEDKRNSKGMTPEELATKIVSAIRKKKEEVYIGGFMEMTSIYMKRFLPGIFSKLVRKVKIDRVPSQQ